MSTKRAVFLITVLCFFITVIWFARGLMFGGGEEGIPLFNLASYVKTASYAWNEGQAGYDMVLLLPRVPYFSVLAVFFKMGASAVLLQAITFFLLMCSGCFAVFFLSEELVIDKKVSFISSVFYLLNPYSMVQIWGRGIYAQFFAFSLVPTFLMFYIAGLRSKKPIFYILAILTSLILSPAFVFPTQIVVIWMPVAVYLVFYCLNFRKNIREIVYAVSATVILGIAWLGVHSWWLWPYFKTITTSVSKLGDINYNLGSLKGISSESGFSVVTRLVHKFMYNGSYGAIYASRLFIFLSWIIPALTVLSLTMLHKNKYLRFCWSLLFVGLFVVMGTNSPLGFVFEWLFRNLSPFQGFRNPYEKAGLLVLVAIAPLVAIGLSKFKGPLKSSILILLCGVYVWPMWTGQFAGGTKFNPWFEVPNYYREADTWINTQDPESRVIQLPLNPGDGVFYKWKHSFQGLESGDLIFSNPSIGKNITINKNYYNVLLERFGVLQKNAFGPDPDISNSDFKSESLSGELEKLNVHYIVLHRDVESSISGMKSVEETAVYLNGDRNIKKVKTFGLLDIYEVKLTSGLAHVFSPSETITFQKINPTLYQIQIKDVKQPYVVNFLERFDKGWKLIIDDKEVDSHSLVYSYANSWTVNKLGSYNGYIKYQPQNYVAQGTFISMITLMTIIVIGVLSLI